ncbi:unnamed protein product [Rhizophagus irregularis]|uniref:Uncharacterized protein n=1 Tax=Rhizophagus irregularis TaxID=588596 RepID=A0A916E9K0_9GLOM|nr:unnamed protein product [Rhizophagus irregularis]
MLQRMLALRVEPFDRGDVGPIDCRDRGDARPRCPPADMHRARPAHANAAAEFGTGQPDLVADHPQERGVVLDCGGNGATVDRETGGDAGDIGVAKPGAKARHHHARRAVLRVDAVEDDADHIGRIVEMHGAVERQIGAQRVEPLAAIVMARCAGSREQPRARIVLQAGADTVGGERLLDQRGILPGARSGPIEAGEIGGDRRHIGGGETGKPARHRRHRPRRRAMIQADPGAEIGDQFGLAPRDRRGVGLVERRRDPIVDRGPGIGLVLTLGPKRPTRRVARCAMADPFGEIGTTIPGRILGRDGLIAARLEEQQFPASLQQADVEREGQAIGLVLGAHRRLRHQIGIERRDIGIGQLGEMIIGESGEEMCAVAPHAFMHGAAEGGFGPAANAGVDIGGDVGRIDRAEGGGHRIAARQRSTTLGGVARCAIAGTRQHCALGDEGGREGRGSRTSNRGNRRPPGKARKDRQANKKGEDATEKNAFHHAVPAAIIFTLCFACF